MRMPVPDTPWQVAKRARIGVIIPSTNTGVEYDLTKFNLEGVSWHPSRLWIELRNWADESASLVKAPTMCLSDFSI